MKNWFAGTHGPNGEHLIPVARHSDATPNVFLIMAGRQALIEGLNLQEFRAKLLETAAIIDEVFTIADE